VALPVFTTVAQVRAARAQVRAGGQRFALVPTMGFLHEGHVALMQEARRHADIVGVSIFVNPTQFGPNEDLSRYPRDLPGDVAKCEAAGVAWVFAPEPAEMYPAEAQTFVEVTQVSQGLCGERRPGHFRGVATVVTQLFAIFRPDVAVFGEKDFQQLQVIRALNRDLHLGVEIVGVPTIREPDGLAKSSRNAYLTPPQRSLAVSLSKGLMEARERYRRGERDAARLKEGVRDALPESVRLDYVELVDSRTLKPITKVQEGVAGRLLVAAFVGTTRLIDNVSLGEESP
jgi:pantoate--beta-alanine ligase